MEMMVLKFRANDLNPSLGKQIEFNPNVINTFFKFTNDVENIVFIYKSIFDNDTNDETRINLSLKKSPARGDYKIYQNEDGGLFFKNFLLENLKLSDRNINDYISIKKIDKNSFYFSYIPESSEIGKFFKMNNLGLHGGSIIQKEENEQNQSTSYVLNFSQIIYYGVPGSGKSHKIDEATKDLPEDQKMRVVFHPEYTNADFVGQILPSNTSGTISYQFKPGPFTKILRRAYLNPSKKYYLIIEEINRGNAAAIFGDVFQLLDRITDGKSEIIGGYSYGNGWSRYSIENDFMNWYIRENLYANHKLQNENDGIAEKSDESQKSIEIGNLHFSALTGIRLPPNLSLFATMNTSDQNVFTLDNAFQRRWDMKLVENKFEGEDADAQRNAKIGGTEVTWEIFQTFINKKIGESSSSEGMSSMEDKRLGCWFVKAEDNGEESIIPKEKFAEKVLKYLWDDAFKFNHDNVFNIQENTSFESIVERFKGKDDGSCDWSIFKDTSFIQSANE